MADFWIHIVSEQVPQVPSPDWMRTLLVHEATGDVFAPAACSPPGEVGAVLCASFDGVTLLMHERHAFVPLAWLEQEYPSWSDLWSTLRGKVSRGLAAVEV